MQSQQLAKTKRQGKDGRKGFVFIISPLLLLKLWSAELSVASHELETASVPIRH